MTENLRIQENYLGVNPQMAEQSLNYQTERQAILDSAKQNMESAHNSLLTSYVRQEEVEHTASEIQADYDEAITLIAEWDGEINNLQSQRETLLSSSPSDIKEAKSRDRQVGQLNEQIDDLYAAKNEMNDELRGYMTTELNNVLDQRDAAYAVTNAAEKNFASAQTLYSNTEASMNKTTEAEDITDYMGKPAPAGDITDNMNVKKGSIVVEDRQYSPEPASAADDLYVEEVAN